MKQFSFLILLICTNVFYVTSQNTRWQQSVQYVMNVDMDVEKNTFNGVQNLTYKNNSPEKLDRLFYHLYWNAFQPNSSMDVRSRELGKQVINGRQEWDGRVKDRISMLKQNEIGFESLQERNQSDSIEKREGDTKQGIDPCNGTEGTGQIMSIKEGSITIKKRDGKDEVVVFTYKTAFSNASGKATKSILKVGDRVTVVIDDSNTAMAVLVCGIK